MNVYRIYLFISWFDFTPLLIFVSNKKGENIVLFFTLTPLLMIDKKGEKYLSIYALFRKEFLVYAYCFVLQIGEKELDVFHACLCMFISLYLHTCLWAFIAYLFVFCYTWVKGELLWSFTLIHAYITPWVLSSSKRERLLA